MNTVMKTALNHNYQGIPFSLRAAFFHSTPVSDRKRRTHWDSGDGGAFRGSTKRFNHYAKRFRKFHAKQTLLRNVSAYAEHLFQSWQSDDDQRVSSSSRGTSWVKRQYWTKGTQKTGFGNQGPQQFGRKGFRFCTDDGEEVETIFRFTFGGERSFYWSLINEEIPQWSDSYYSSNKHRSSWNWRHRLEDEYDTSTEYENSESDLASDRLALGLSASGPLKLEEVKSAYRACALKWHPDRHQGSSKALAEEKFKLCSSAYQTICDKLDVD
ncbi:uncharacterized protein LOC122641397 [Telopea speciosissima]|uniref:uncharacterized protein LOC122641397 n=1 Tax=Telopea speciosissima TaxID=54955 RepID=UPI001CC4CB4C|nr:uncharacterized protein LOC122641397 [Telopea speciosissima]